MSMHLLAAAPAMLLKVCVQDKMKFVVQMLNALLHRVMDSACKQAFVMVNL